MKVHKETLRKKALEKRNSIPSSERKKKDELIKNKLFEMTEFKRANTIFFYASVRTEVDTMGMMEESLKMGKRVVVSKVDRERHRLILYEIKDINELSPGYKGIPEPSSYNARIVDIRGVDVVIVPGAGFDSFGNRLGYGAGYYDILLSKIKKKIPLVALAYEEQLIGFIPSEFHDVKMDVIVTDKQVIKAC
ncbi:MAG: 5-formyltetrahydrofolate cyclo-ligase [Nitrospirota bacterium]